MDRNTSLWPVKGFEDAALRKRIAYFRPWIEDRKVCLLGSDPLAKAYVKALASEITAQENAEFILFANGAASDIQEIKAWAEQNGKAFAGWGSDEGESNWAQSKVWPFAIGDSEQGEPISIHAGSLPAIAHPRVGIAIPSHAHLSAAKDAIQTIAAEYPGFVRCVVVANGAKPSETVSITSLAEDHPDLVTVLEFDQNLGYGRGCNAGLAELMKDASLDFVGVLNDDVLPGPDCLLELVRAFHELNDIGLNPGAIGPVSNEINGSQRVELRPFANLDQMRERAWNYWTANHSSAAQAVQVRGLFLLWSRKCAEAVGGFDPRFGIGNFEDDDHNLRTRLAGFTLWIAQGAFLFHHGSSTFKTLNVDYEANIRRNAEAMMRKWQIASLEDWVTLAQTPKGTILYQPFDAIQDNAHRIKINGEEVDLIRQASDIEFAAWVMGHPQAKTAEGRQALVELLIQAA